MPVLLSRHNRRNPIEYDNTLNSGPGHAETQPQCLVKKKSRPAIRRSARAEQIPELQSVQKLQE